MPDVETRNLPSYEEFARRMERARDDVDFDRLIAEYYVTVNGGNGVPTKDDMARTIEAVRQKVSPRVMRVLYESLMEMASER